MKTKNQIIAFALLNHMDFEDTFYRFYELKCQECDMLKEETKALRRSKGLLRKEYNQLLKVKGAGCLNY